MIGIDEGGTSPSKPNARRRQLAGGKITGSNEVNAHGVGACEWVGSSAVEVGDWLRKMGKEVDKRMPSVDGISKCRGKSRNVPAVPDSGRSARPP